MVFIILLILVLCALTAAVLIPSHYETNDRRSGSLWFAKGIVLAFAALLGLLALFQLVAIVPAGHVGIIDTFGNVSERVLQPGISLVNPFASIKSLSVQTQELKETMEVPSKEGLAMLLEVSVLYRLDPTKARNVYKEIGTNYVNVLLIPNFRSVVRDATASNDAKTLYTSQRAVLATKIQTDLASLVASKGVIVESTPLRKIGLPNELSIAITEKLQMEQASQKMHFVLEKETQEAERKRIEAQGIHDFQAIVTQGISDPLLRWKGIEATELLAKSPNTKVIVIGSGKDGLPLIMDTR